MKVSMNYIIEDIIGKGSSWPRPVSSVKKQALLVAKDLVESYISRNTTKSKACYMDREIERDFLSGFPYKDTKDQQTSSHTVNYYLIT